MKKVTRFEELEYTHHRGGIHKVWYDFGEGEYPQHFWINGDELQIVKKRKELEEFVDSLKISKTNCVRLLEIVSNYREAVEDKVRGDCAEDAAGIDI